MFLQEHALHNDRQNVLRPPISVERGRIQWSLVTPWSHADLGGRCRSLGSSRDEGDGVTAMTETEISGSSTKTGGTSRYGKTTAPLSSGERPLLAPGIHGEAVPMRDWSRDEVDFCVVGAGAGGGVVGAKLAEAGF